MIGCADVDAAAVYAVAVDSAAGVDFVDGADADVDFVDAIARDGIARASRVVRDNPLTRAS